MIGLAMTGKSQSVRQSRFTRARAMGHGRVAQMGTSVLIRSYHYFCAHSARPGPANSSSLESPPEPVTVSFQVHSGPLPWGRTRRICTQCQAGSSSHDVADGRALFTLHAQLQEADNNRFLISRLVQAKSSAHRSRSLHARRGFPLILGEGFL